MGLAGMCLVCAGIPSGQVFIDKLVKLSFHLYVELFYGNTVLVVGPFHYQFLSNLKKNPLLQSKLE